jgi:ssDNA-binding replication factor A large subunit
MYTEEELIQQILSKNPEVKRNQILEDLETEKTKTAGLIANATLLRLIAARYGLQNLHNRDFDRRLSINNLIPGLNDVTVVGRVATVYPPKTFEGKKTGKLASLMVFDENSIIRVVLWNDKVDLIETEKLKAGYIARFAHGYTREDRNGKVELHIGEKSEIEIGPEDEKENGRFVCNFTTKIKDIIKTQNNIHIQGTVKKLSPSTNFKNDFGTGTVLRFSLGDETGEIPIVVWNEKAEEVEKILRTNSNVRLINARVKATQNGQFEIHVDSYSYVNVSNSAL